MHVDLLKRIRALLEDVQSELCAPEVADLTSMALDRKLEAMMHELEVEIENGEEE